MTPATAARRVALARPTTAWVLTVAAFAARLQDAVALDTVRDDLAATVQTALEPAHVSVWTAGGNR